MTPLDVLSYVRAQRRLAATTVSAQEGGYLRPPPVSGRPLELELGPGRSCFSDPGFAAQHAPRLRQ